MNQSQIKTGALLSYIALFSSSMIALVYTPFMLRMLGQAEYGLFSLVNTTIAYLTVLDFGFGTAIVRYTAKYRAENDKLKEETLHGMFLVLYICIGIISFLLALLLVLNTEWLFSASLNVKELKTAKILMWLAAINLAMNFPFSIYSSIIIAYERFVFAKAINIMRMLINSLLVVIVLAIGYKSVGMIVVTTVFNLLFNLINLVYCRFNLQIKMRFTSFSLPLLKEIGAYSFFVFLNLIVDRIYWSSGQFLLGISVGVTAVAIYSIGIQFVTMLYMPVSGVIFNLFLPRVTQISVKESAQYELSELFIKVGRIQFIILALFLSGFILYGKQFVNLWAGPRYSTSYLVAMILIIPLTVPLIQTTGISILQAKNMHSFRAIVYLLIAVVNVAISVPMIKLWGPIGSAIGTAASLTIGQIMVMNIYYCTHLRLEIGKFWREISKMVPATLLPCGFAFLLKQLISADRLSTFVFNVVLYTIIYCLSMYFCGMNLYERQLILNPLKNLVKRFCMVREQA